MDKPVIAITLGDAAGVGPELCLRALADPETAACCTPVVFGHAGLLRRVAECCGLPYAAAAAGPGDWAARAAAGERLVVTCGEFDAAAVRPGAVQAACGALAHRCVADAVRAALAGAAAAVVTAPLNKAALHAAGVPFPGHTEMLAHLTGASRYCMTMAADELIVSLATIHTGIAGVPRALTADGILTAIALTAEALGRLGKPRPRIGVCALNPHGGEGGLFGDEERRIVQPAIAAARARGYAVEGPLVPDTAFVPERRAALDAYVAMYHDQGLIPFKMLAFDRGVNVTLGLPIVRTSVDHGTAFDIAWQGRASVRSLLEAIRWAVRLARARPA